MAQLDRETLLREWYEHHYSRLAATADDSPLAHYLHGAMERPFGPERRFARVLEVGGNRGEHVPYVRHHYGEYVLTDLREPVPGADLLDDGRLSVGACDVQDLPFDDSSFDRVIATCLLHHVADPLRAAEELRRVVRPGGIVTMLIPCDPGMAYRAARAMTSGRAARRAPGRHGRAHATRACAGPSQSRGLDPPAGGGRVQCRRARTAVEAVPVAVVERQCVRRAARHPDD